MYFAVLMTYYRSTFFLIFRILDSKEKILMYFIFLFLLMNTRMYLIHCGKRIGSAAGLPGKKA